MSYFKCGNGIWVPCFGYSLSNTVIDSEAVISTIGCDPAVAKDYIIFRY